MAERELIASLDLMASLMKVWCFIGCGTALEPTVRSHSLWRRSNLLISLLALSERLRIRGRRVASSFRPSLVRDHLLSTLCTNPSLFSWLMARLVEDLGDSKIRESSETVSTSSSSPRYKRIRSCSLAFGERTCWPTPRSRISLGRG